jgi:hypothetical protein
MTKFFAVVVAVLVAPLLGWLLAPAIMFLPVILAASLPVLALALVFMRPQRALARPVHAELAFAAAGADHGPSALSCDDAERELTRSRAA